MTAASNDNQSKLAFPVLLTLTAIVCLAVIQTLGANCSLPIATAAAVLVFYIRQPTFTTWELLYQLYSMRTTPPKF